jgi:2-polyprenyl-3-methyl-5-hydroxy-6-metoxy-1,4-benzoquinol methylase
MRRLQPPGREPWPVRLEELEVGRPDLAGRRFDVITCLWNVLGHVEGARHRAHGLARLGSLLSPGGVLFVDVTHRYNTRSYGLLRTAARAAWDALRPCATNGDVVVEWTLGGSRCATRGHVFTRPEMQGLVQEAGLAVTQCLAVDYETGQPVSSAWRGNLLYVLRAHRAS